MLAALAGLGLLAAGCSGDAGSLAATAGSGGHTARETSPPSSTPPAVSHGAPPVRHPIDTTHFRKHPCEFITSKQIKRLGVPVTPKPDLTTKGFHACAWVPPPSGEIAFSVTFIPNKHGLSDVYTLAQQGHYEVFTKGPIANGSPTVIALVSDGRSSGDCAYDVGLNNSDVVDVLMQSDKHGDPCHDALQVVKDVTLTAKRSG
jgi:hypothetical protein